MDVLKVACVQTTLTWEDPERNRKHLAGIIKSIDQSVDVIVLPEMFTTGFSMEPAPIAESMTGNTVDWMRIIAEKANAVIAGSVIIEENGNYYNRLLWITPVGHLEYYDKRHLFSLAGEDGAYSSGNEIKIVEYNSWKICLNICYDLRFPVWSRNVSSYDCAIYVANWPTPRIKAWSSLLMARAIENQSYVVGVNRLGSDRNNNQYNGHSAIIDMEGNYLAEASDSEKIIYATLSKNELLSFRSKLPFNNDRDEFILKT